MSDTLTNSMVSETERFERATFYEAKHFSEKRSQCEMTLEYMQMFGSITPLEALSAFGCFRLPARICDLREDGHRISTEINKGRKKYAIYRLEDEDGREEESL